MVLSSLTAHSSDVVTSSKDGPGPVRVLHALACLNLGGIETWLMEIMRHTSHQDITIDVCTTLDKNGAYDEEFLTLGGHIHRCPLHRNPWAFGRRLEQLLRTQRYDVVHSHLSYFSGFVLRAAARAGVPIRIAHNHRTGDDLAARGTFRPLYRHWMYRWIEKYGTDFLAPSKAGMASFWGTNWQTNSRKRVLYCGISVEKFRQSGNRAALRAELGLPPEARLILNVGRFIPSKRQSFLVDVAQQVAARRRDVYFVLIGTGPLRAEVERMVNTLGLSHTVRFVPAQPGIERFWLAADIFAFPSVNEGFGIVIVEAAAAGLPVIAHDIPGVREAASACENPVLLPLDASPGQWADAIAAGLDRPAWSDSRRTEMLHSFPFTIESSIRSLKEVYRVGGPSKGATTA